jgi:hypothetical protein
MQHYRVLAWNLLFNSQDSHNTKKKGATTVMTSKRSSLREERKQSAPSSASASTTHAGATRKPGACKQDKHEDDRFSQQIIDKWREEDAEIAQEDEQGLREQPEYEAFVDADFSFAMSSWQQAQLEGGTLRIRLTDIDRIFEMIHQECLPSIDFEAFEAKDQNRTLIQKFYNDFGARLWQIPTFDTRGRVRLRLLFRLLLDAASACLWMSSGESNFAARSELAVTCLEVLQFARILLDGNELQGTDMTFILEYLSLNHAAHRDKVISSSSSSSSSCNTLSTCGDPQPMLLAPVNSPGKQLALVSCRPCVSTCVKLTR